MIQGLCYVNTSTDMYGLQVDLPRYETIKFALNPSSIPSASNLERKIVSHSCGVSRMTVHTVASSSQLTLQASEKSCIVNQRRSTYLAFVQERLQQRIPGQLKLYNPCQCPKEYDNRAGPANLQPQLHQLRQRRCKSQRISWPPFVQREARLRDLTPAAH